MIETHPQSDLLPNGRCLKLQVSLAQKIGLNEAIVVQQLYFLLGLPGGKTIDGLHWIFNTYEKWQEDHFPFWSINTIQRIFCDLEAMFIVESCQPDGHMSRKKYYRLNQGMVVKFLKGSLPTPELPKSSKSLMIPEDTKMGSSSPQNGVMEDTKLIPSLTETTQRVPNRESKESPPAESASFSKISIWNKAEDLKAIQSPPNAPSVSEFNAFIRSEALGNIMNHRPNLYDELRRDKWHLWDKRQGWRPIYDWRALVAGLDEMIEEAPKTRRTRRR